MVALLIEETANEIESQQIKSKFWFLVRGENKGAQGKTSQSREPTNSTRVWRRGQNRTQAMMVKGGSDVTVGEGWTRSPFCPG